MMAECRHREFVIEVFQLRPNLWNMRVRRLDDALITYSGISCQSLYLGDPWPTPAAAFNDAKQFIDRMSTSKHN
jgi:hypothetical protein